MLARPAPLPLLRVQAYERFRDQILQARIRPGQVLSQRALTELLGVPAALIEAHGAVSEPVARAMAAGALSRSAAQVAVAVTGVAGPTGGSADKPVGLVWFGFALPHQVLSEKMIFAGDRAAVRAATVQHVLQRLVQLLETSP